MEWISLVLLLFIFAVAIIWLRTRSRVRYGTVNYLIPGKDDEPLRPREAFVSGINHVGLCGEHRQDIIAMLRPGESIFLVRQRGNPQDANAIILYAKSGKDIGFVPRDTAMEIAPRLDRGSPVTATVSAIEPFETEDRKRLLGVRLLLVPHKLRRT